MGLERRGDMRGAGLILGFLLLCGARQEARIEHVVLVSIDGLRPEFYLGDYDAPTLKELARDGAHVKAVESVYPSVTYAAHATIVTGVRPWKHGIYANTTWTERGSTRDWQWYARGLKRAYLKRARVQLSMMVRIRGCTRWSLSHQRTRPPMRPRTSA